MRVIVKVRFNASKESFENFGSSKYLIYLPLAESNDSNLIIIQILSKNLGVSPSKIKYSGLDAHKDRIFELL